MTVDTNIDTLVINKLTQAQYDAIETKNPQELYIITDAAAADVLDEDTRNIIDSLVEQAKYHVTKADLDALQETVAAATNKVFRYKGSVNSYSDLPANGNIIGDVYNIVNASAGNEEVPEIKAGDNVVWNGETWDVLSGIVDLSNLAKDANVVHTTGNEAVKGTKTFDNVIVEFSELSDVIPGEGNYAGVTTKYTFPLTDGTPTVVKMKANSGSGSIGTTTNKAFNIRTNDTNRMTFGADGSILLTDAPAQDSNNNQVATTAWTRKQTEQRITGLPDVRTMWAVYEKYRSIDDLFGDNPQPASYRIVKKAAGDVVVGDVAFEWDPTSQTITSQTEYIITDVKPYSIKFDDITYTRKDDLAYVTPEQPSNVEVQLTDNSVNTLVIYNNITFKLPKIGSGSDILGSDLPTDDIFHQILVQIKLPEVKTITVGTNRYFNEKEPDFSKPGLYNLIYEYDVFAKKWVCGSIYKGEIPSSGSNEGILDDLDDYLS